MRTPDRRSRALTRFDPCALHRGPDAIKRKPGGQVVSQAALAFELAGAIGQTPLRVERTAAVITSGRLDLATLGVNNVLPITRAIATERLEQVSRNTRTVDYGTSQRRSGALSLHRSLIHFDREFVKGTYFDRRIVHRMIGPALVLGGRTEMMGAGNA